MEAILVRRWLIRVRIGSLGVDYKRLLMILPTKTCSFLQGLELEVEGLVQSFAATESCPRVTESDHTQSIISLERCTSRRHFIFAALDGFSYES